MDRHVLEIRSRSLSDSGREACLPRDFEKGCCHSLDSLFNQLHNETIDSVPYSIYITESTEESGEESILQAKSF